MHVILSSMAEKKSRNAGYLIVIVAAVGLVFGISCETLSAEDKRELSPEELVYQKVLEVDGSKEELFTKCAEWIALTFRSAKAVIEHQDEEQGKIIGNGIVEVNYGLGPVNTRFTLIIETKDNRIRATAENMHTEMTISGQFMSNPLSFGLQMRKFSAQADILLSDLEEYLGKDTADW